MAKTQTLKATCLEVERLVVRSPHGGCVEITGDHIALCDELARPRIELDHGSDGEYAFTVLDYAGSDDPDADRRPRAELIWHDGAVMLTLYDPDRERRGARLAGASPVVFERVVPPRRSADA